MSDTTTQAREAALLVHSLPPAARRQVLQRLDTAERARIEPWLAELASLGIPRLPAERLDALRLPDAPRDDVARLRDMTAVQLLALLHDAGPATLALLLRVADWPWKADLLAGLDAPRRERTLALCAAQADGAVPRAAADALCRRVLAQRARVDGDTRPTARARPRWTRWFAWSR
jgi:hypothetical protein